MDQGQSAEVTILYVRVKQLSDERSSGREEHQSDPAGDGRFHDTYQSDDGSQRWVESAKHGAP